MFFRKAHSLFIGCFWLVISGASAQDQKIADSLALIYQGNTLADTAKLELLRNLSFNETRDMEKGIKYAEELIRLSKLNGNNIYLRRAYFLKGTKKRLQGNLDEALAAYIKSAEVARESHHANAEAEAYSAIGDTYVAANNPTTAKEYYNKAITTLRQSKSQSQEDSINIASVLTNAGEAFRITKEYDSAVIFFNEAKSIFDKVNYLTGTAYCLGNIGMVYASLGKNDLAEKHMNEASGILEQNQDYYPVCDFLISYADVYLNKGNDRTALNYALRSLRLAEQHGLKEQIANANLKLSELYERTGDLRQALNSYKTYIAYRDSLTNIKTVQKMADLRTNYEVSQKQIEVNLLNQQKRNDRNLTIFLGIILGLTVIILGILLRNNQAKQKAFRILDLQKQETDKQKAKAENALSELQVTQKQLIQSAKMASLGEITAGIAHEIQNPLNFVNNFSEVSVELLADLVEGTVNKLTASDKAEADKIINDLADNLKKISHHGRRADSIVKGMLQHSRISAIKKEPSDINALTEEYLKLSYHGLRAKDNTFNAYIETEFDKNLEKLLIAPQDIGRVLINIYNNAFYSIQQKTKLNVEGYKPTLRVTTGSIQKDGELKAIQIHIRDNGMGIPDKILDKIFQPFFTTKPAGQGTGLGLSLSYDIIENEHQGKLRVETKEGAYTEFVIELPNKKG